MTQRTLQCIIGFFLFGSFASFGQQASLLVLDGQNDEPIEFAHVVYFSPSGKELGITDVDGRLVMDIEQPVSFAVTYVGYKTVSGTIEPGADRALRLVRGDYRLDDVVVTAQYSAIRPEESIILIRVIGNEQIESKGALNLSQLLNDELNIRLQTDGILGTGLSVQGLSGQNVKILVDGVPIIGRLDGIIDLNQINLQDIERVEIVEGPVSVNYGSNALAGAVNLISKKPKNDKLSGGGGFFYESVGVYNTDAWLDIPIHGKQSLRLSGGTNFFDGWSPIENGQRDLQWNQKEQLFGRAAYSTKLGKIDLGYEIRGFNELIKDKGERRSAYSNYAFDNWFTTYRVDNQISVGVPLGSKWKMDFIAGYNWFRRDNVQYNRDLVNLTEEVNSDARPHDTTRNSLFISRGTLGSINQEKAVNFQLGYEVNYETGGGKRIKDDYQSIGDYALFGSLQWKVTKDIKLQPGIRVSYNTDYVAQPVPSVHASWSTSKSCQMRASYARGFRAPTIKELYIEFIDANHNILGNQNLRAEYSHHADLTLEYKLGDARGVNNSRIELGLFFNNLLNQIELAQVEGSRFSYVNINETTTAGGQVELDFAIHPEINFKTGFTWLFQQFDVGGDKKQFSSPEALIGFKYSKPSQKFGVYINYKFTGQTPQVTLPEAGVDVSSIESFHWLDMSATQKFWKNKIAFTLGVRNLLDVQNLASTSAGGVHGGGGAVPMSWGRTAFSSLKISL